MSFGTQRVRAGLTCFAPPGLRSVAYWRGKDAWRVRNFKTLHEIFRVYVDEEGVLRTDHEIRFVGLTILRLHYKMTRKSGKLDEAMNVADVELV